MKILSIDKDKVQVELTRKEILDCFEQLKPFFQSEAYITTMADEIPSLAIEKLKAGTLIHLLKQIICGELNPFNGYHKDMKI